MHIEHENNPYAYPQINKPEPVSVIPETKGYQGKPKTAEKTLTDIYGCQELKKQQEMLAQKQAQIPLQPIGITTPFIPPQFQTYLSTFMKNFYTPFIYKDYNINIGGPNANHQTVSSIFEDALPPADVFSSYKTLRERNNLSEYIRGTFISTDEGELVDFGDSERSLTKRLKLLELNPYNPNNYSNNPYKGLPIGMLIYKSGYPITYDSSTGMVKCSKNSVGITMRVYELTLEELAVKYIFTNQQTLINGIEDKINEFIKNNESKLNSLNLEKYNAWREITYYAYIREKINKDSISPNFVSSYCYFINRNSNITFAKNGPQSILGESKPDCTKGNFPKTNTASVNTALIILTESPNMNIICWGTNLYKEERGVNTMIYSGFKPAQQWESVIAQMLIVFYVMDKFKFTINGMDIINNFYIKDLNVLGQSKQYWLYTINDIDYYIPNFGNLLMCDNNYKDLKKNDAKNVTKLENYGIHLNEQTYEQIITQLDKNEILKKNKKDEYEELRCFIMSLKGNYKVLMEQLGDDENTISTMIRNNAIECFSFNSWVNNKYEGKNSFITPDSSVINTLKNINNDLNAKKDSTADYKYTFSGIIEKYLKKYINNRVGTDIRDLEVPYIKKNDIRPFKKGEIVIYQGEFEKYQILLFIKNIEDDDNSCLCIGEKFEEKTVNRDLLYHYSEYEPIKQDLKPGEPMIGFDHIIEKYTL